jgi:YYY domain-containing protein
LTTTFLAWWVVQLSGGLIPWSGGTLWVCLFLVAGIAWRLRSGSPKTPDSRRAEHVADFLFLAGFWLGLALRLGAPEILGQEKFMDLAMLGSCATSSVLPPADPWLGAGAVNYYYGGYLLMAAPAKMLGLAPELVYNLGFGLLVGLIFQTAFALSHLLCRRIGWALLGVASTGLLGNLSTAFERARNWRASGRLETDWIHYVWAPSRVIVDGLHGGETGQTISEFPFFSWMVGDLHPHVMAAPFVLLFLAAFGRAKWWAIGWLLGWLGFINGFDMISMAWVALALGLILDRQGRPSRALLRWIGTLLVAFLAFAPFYLHYRPPAQNPPLGWSEFHSGMGEFLAVWGLPLCGVLMLLVSAWARRLPRDRPWALLCAILAAALGGVLVWRGMAVSGMLAALAVATLGLLTRREGRRPRPSFALGLVFAVLMILLGCEIVHVRDSYGRVLQRMNTLFKFYYPVWLALGAILPLGFRELARSRALGLWIKVPIIAVGAILVLAAAEYPLVVGGQRLKEAVGKEQPTLDGMIWMRREAPAEAAAIEWLRVHAKPGELVLEAVGGPYTRHARVATFTPLRGVLGWPNHQWVWRGRAFEELEADIRRIYDEEDFGAARALIENHRIDYVFIGSLEKEAHSEKGIKKFGQNARPVYRDPEGLVEIYRFGPWPSSSTR